MVRVPPGRYLQQRDETPAPPGAFTWHSPRSIAKSVKHMSDAVQNEVAGTMAKDAPKAQSKLLGRIVPLALIGAGFAAFFIFDLGSYLSIEALRENRAWLADQVAGNHLLAALTYIAIYAAAVAVSVPGATILTLLGGFLFGAILGTTYTVVGATVGATLIFLAAKTALADLLRAKAGAALSKMQDGFQENELNYLFVLRLVPAFPFFVVNIVPGLLGVSLRNFVIATFFGIIPGTAVYATFGAGLGEIFEAGGELSLEGVLSPELIAGMIGLAALAMLPVVLKKIAARKKAGSSNP